MDISVLVTGVGSITTGEQIYRALLSGRRRYRIAVANVELRRMMVADDVVKVVLPTADHPDYVAELAAAANRLGAAFIFPGSDAELVRVAADRDVLAGLTRAVPIANNATVVGTCLDKQATVCAIQRAGLAVPATVECPTPAAALEAVESGRLRYPVVVKPQSGSAGSANVFVAQDHAELEFFIRFALYNVRSLILQEYVGTSDHEYSASVLHYPDGTLAGTCVARRYLTDRYRLSTVLRTPNRTGRAELGPWLVISSGHSQGDIDDYPEVRAAAERVAAELHSTGPLNVQGRLAGSEFYVFEVNPRFSGSTGLRAMAGHNGPEMMIDWHLREQAHLPPRIARAYFIRGLRDYVERA